MKETHINLRGGEGVVTTQTKSFRIFKKKFMFVKFHLNPYTSIGTHLHEDQNEIYFTFNPYVRFNHRTKWRMFAFFKKGRAHSLQSDSQGYANVFAIKF